MPFGATKLYILSKFFHIIILNIMKINYYVSENLTYKHRSFNLGI